MCIYRNVLMALEEGGELYMVYKHLQSQITQVQK